MKIKLSDILGLSLKAVSALKPDSKSKKKQPKPTIYDSPDRKPFDFKRFKELDAYILANSVGDVIEAAERMLSKEDCELYKKGLKYQATTGNRIQ